MPRKPASNAGRRQGKNQSSADDHHDKTNYCHHNDRFYHGFHIKSVFLNDSFKALVWKSNKFSLTNFLRNALSGKLIARLPKVLKITANGIGAI